MMELDFVSEVDKKFYSDNFLLNEDWDSGGSCVDDLSQLLGVDGGVCAEDFISSLPDDLEIPILGGGDMLTDQDLLTSDGLPLVSESLRDLSDGSDSGLDCGSVLIKDEPLSPASSLSSDTQQDSGLQFMDVSFTTTPSFAGVLPADIKLESPPLTPERDQTSDFTGFTQKAPTPALPANGLKIDFSNLNGQVPTIATKLPPGSKIVTGSNGIRIIQQPVAPVLNKVKIQPKPPAPLQPKATLPTPAPGKPLVLTPEEFAKLTSSGVLKFQHPNEPATPAAPSPLHTPQVITAPPPAYQGTKLTGGGDKRAQRMIKNRESACLSRKRKKEYVTNMEKQLSQVASENARLKEQNDQLRKRVKMLQSENDQLKTFSVGGQVKKATAVMAVLFLISLNLGPLTGILNTDSTTKQLVEPRANSLLHHSRTLLSFNENGSDSSSKPDNASTQPKSTWPSTSLHSISAALEGLKSMTGKTTSGSGDLMMLKRLEEMNIPLSMCPSYFNTSESMRLMNELNGWVLGHKAGMKAAADAAGTHQNPNDPRAPSQHKRLLRKKYVAPRKLKAALRGNIPRQDKAHPSQYEVQVFTGPDRHYQDFMSAIHRRNDTFYVVSFRRDHLLLPATAHNQTMRPRMSFLMPAVSINETMDIPAGNIAMMQIDCEVMATKLLHVHKSTVPKDAEVGNHSNRTAPPSVDGGRNQRNRKWQQKTKWRQTP